MAKAAAAPYKIEKRKDNRYQVKKRGGGFIGGDEKVKILVDAGLIKTKLAAKPAEEVPAEEAPVAEEASAETE